jgi:hypothetical protein
MTFAATHGTMPKVQWHGRRVNVVIVNKTLGLTSKEWILAAFCNDQWFQMRQAAMASVELQKAVIERHNER